MKFILILMMSLFFSSSLFAVQKNSKQIISCFIATMDREISRHLEENPKEAQEQRMCHQLPRKVKIWLWDDHSTNDGEIIYFYSADFLNSTRFHEDLRSWSLDLSGYVSCYRDFTTQSGPFGAIGNSPTYGRNLNLIQSTFAKMANAKWSEINRSPLSEIRFINCPLAN